jgi:hypothetical protein
MWAILFIQANTAFFYAGMLLLPAGDDTLKTPVKRFRTGIALVCMYNEYIVKPPFTIHCPLAVGEEAIICIPLREERVIGKLLQSIYIIYYNTAFAFHLILLYKSCWQQNLISCKNQNRMNTYLKHREILLMANSSFSSREWAVRNELKEGNALTAKERLTQACWNGLAPEMLPECFDSPFEKSLFLWEINEANVFIALEYGEMMRRKDKIFSVNPYIFMELQHYS